MIQENHAQTLGRLLKQACDTFAEHVLTVEEEKPVTYRQTALHAQALVRQLYETGLRAGDAVGICLPLCASYAAALIAVLSLGGVAVPIDPRCPARKAVQMLRRAGAVCAIGGHGQLEGEIPILEPDKVPELGESCWPGQLEWSVSPDSPAFCFFTSGSLGEPKQVFLTHRGICHTVQAKRQVLELCEDDVVACTFSPGFVASIWCVAATMLSGARLVVYQGSSDDWNARCRTWEQATIIALTPSALQAVLGLEQAQQHPIALKESRYLVLTGEEVTGALLDRYFRSHSVPLINAYGATECSDDVLHARIDHPLPSGSIPVGRPIPHTQVKIMQEGKPAAAGQTGEIWISGPSVVAGYVGQEQEENEKFCCQDGETWYRSGDLGSMDEKGIVYYLGRMDDQIKRAGYKIRLHELTDQALALEGIEEAYAMVKDPAQQQQLILFVAGQQVQKESVMTALRQRLPWYLLPDRCEVLPRLPRQQNGKIDRRALETERQAPDDFDGLWAETFGDDFPFLEDGQVPAGKSLAFAILIARISQKLGKQVSIQTLLDHPDMQSMKETIRRNLKAEAIEEKGPHNEETDSGTELFLRRS